MIKYLGLALLSVGFLSGCASMALPGDKNCTTDFLQCIEEPKEVESHDDNDLTRNLSKHAIDCRHQRGISTQEIAQCLSEG